MRKLVTIFIVVPLGIVIVLFAVANRGIVTLVFDPFDSAQPAIALKMPLFLLSFVLVGIGILIGGLATWLGQRRWRARARHAERTVRELREKLVEPKWAPAPDNTQPPAPLILPPAA
jgi:hypothetical protein